MELTLDEQADYLLELTFVGILTSLSAMMFLLFTSLTL